MRILIILMILFSIASVSGLVFNDPFNNLNYTVDNWGCYCQNGLNNTSNCYETNQFDANGMLQFLGACGSGPTLQQNFSLTQNITYDRDFKIDVEFKKGYPLSIPPKDIRLVFADNTLWYQINYIWIGLAIEESGDTSLKISCGGSCSCTDTLVPDNNYTGQRYFGNITYDYSTGMLNYSRSDGLYVNATISGCDFSQFNTIFYVRQGDVQGNDYSSALYDLTIDTCDFNYACSSFDVCNQSDILPCLAVTDINECGVPYAGDVSAYDGACDFCTPDWSCSMYGACNISGLKPCLNLTDNLNCSEPFLGDLSDYDGACVYSSSSTSAARRGDVQYCDPTTNICYASIEEAQGKTAFATVPAGTSKNPFKALFDWLKSIFGGAEWP